MKAGSLYLGSLVVSLTLVACGGSADSQEGMDMEEAAAAPAEEVGGRFQLDAAAPFDVTVEDATLTCQDATIASPFRAQWEATDHSASVLVTGFPQEGEGNAHRVDNFQVVWQPTTNDRRDARLSGATLSVELLSQSGRVGTYRVEASGTFAEGGTFTASGTCVA